MNETPLETIRQKLEKLRAIINDTAASEGEKKSAHHRYADILQRHNLTEQDVHASTRNIAIFTLEKTRWGRQLFIQCAAWMFQQQTVMILGGSPRGTFALSLTPLDAADLKACYAYYSQIVKVYEQEKKEEVKKARKQLREKLNLIKEEKAQIIHAVIHRYKLHGPSTKQKEGKKPHQLTEREWREIESRRRAAEKLKGEVWERGEKLDNQQTLLLT